MRQLFKHRSRSHRHGYKHRDLRLHSYPCARLRIWSRETFPAVPSRYGTEVRHCAYRKAGLVGPWRAVHSAKHRLRPKDRFALTGKRTDYFFRAGAGTISNSLAFTIRSPSQFVRLHRKPHQLFFRAGTASIWTDFLYA